MRLDSVMSACKDEVRKLRKLRKKLRQIEALESLEQDLTNEEYAKVS